MFSFLYYQLAKRFLIRSRKDKMERMIFGQKIWKPEQGSKMIEELLCSDSPCMIARIGSVEMQAVNDVYNVRFHLKNEISDVKINTLYTNAGFFPKDKALVPQFEKVYRDACTELDLMAILHNRDEDYWVHSINPNVQYTRLTTLEPYYWPEPWSAVLEGKTVLVVSPFAELIQKQYQNRQYLFANQSVLPAFTLKTIRAVQTIGDNTEGFRDWFEALEYMKKQIEKEDFDVAILGCGAYAFPLAAHCKRLGKKSVVMGGATQIFFGIKGKRWDQSLVVSKMYNSYWQYPSEKERPRGFDQVENGCYW